MSTLIGVVAGVHVSIFASPRGPRAQLHGREVNELTHDDLDALQRLLRKASKLLADRQRIADRRAP